MQQTLTFELPAAIEAALLSCHASGQGTTDYHAMRAVALDLAQTGRLTTPQPVRTGEASRAGDQPTTPHKRRLASGAGVPA